jgi:hypothetical protein
MDGRILIPDRCKPIGRKSRRQCSADDPAEETAARAANDPALDIAYQFIDHLHRICASLGQRAGEPRPKLRQTGRRPYRPGFSGGQMVQAMGKRTIQNWLENIVPYHRPPLCRHRIAFEVASAPGPGSPESDSIAGVLRDAEDAGRQRM